MPNFTAGTSFTDGVTNDVTAAKLNALIADAVPTSSLSLNSTTGTISNFTSSTANITLGTIPTLTTGTTTGTAATFTTGTLTAGVIPTLTSTTLITSGTGTAASPAIQPTGDTNTGIFFPAADTIAFSEGGTESMRIDSSGKVGIGTTSPNASYRMTVSGSRSAVTPGIIFTDSDATPTNYGLYINGNKSFTIYDSTAGANRLLVDSSGNVGIGVTPSAWGSSFVGLQVGGASSIWTDKTNGLRTFINTNTYFDGTNRKYLGNGAASEYLQGTDGSHAWYSAGSGTAGSNITMSERLRIDSSGNVGIGTTSPSRQLHVKSTALIDSNGDGTTGVPSLSIGALLTGFSHIATNNIVAITNGTERLRITSGGNVLFGSTDSDVGGGTVGFKFVYNTTNPYIGIVSDFSGSSSNYHLYNKNATNNGYRFYVGLNGGISNFSANNVNLSDERLKTNISPAGNYLEKICSIPVKTFNYKDQGEDTEKTIGVIAQDVEAVIPELINNDGFGETPEDGIPLKTIYQTDLQYVLMRCIQELSAKVAALEAA